jgi:LPS export ABC transporter protein LptC
MRIRNYLIVGVILFLVSFFVDAVIVRGFAQDLSEHSFEGFDLVGYGDQGQKKWDLKGSSALMEGHDVDIQDVDANVYGDEDMNVKANRGKMNKESGDMHLQGDVVLTSKTGSRMMTDSLDWQKENDLVETNESVTIVRDNMKAVGTGARARPGLNAAQLNENVTVKYDRNGQGQEADILTVTCDGPLEIDYDRQIAIFNDNVVAVNQDRKLSSDQMTLLFDTETKKIKELVCVGNVVIIQGDHVSYSDKAVYQAEDQKIILSGRPKLQMSVQQK